MSLSADQERVLAALEFPGVIRCEIRPAPQIRCRDEARFALRCRMCREITVFCPVHLQKLVALVQVGHAYCGACQRVATTIGVLFDVEPIS